MYALRSFLSKDFGGHTPCPPPLASIAPLSSTPSISMVTIAGWSDLPGDLLMGIMGELEFQESFASAAVCRWWCTVAADLLPLHPVPWLMSWDWRHDRPVHIEFRNLHNRDKTYKLSLPLRRSLCCFGASHGWLIGAAGLCNPVLYNPFTSALIHLPPITGFECKRARSLGKSFYTKAVLSTSPCHGVDCIVVVIHGDDGDQMSFARPGDRCWQLATTMSARMRSIFADCVYHSGRFFTVSMNGVVQAWDLREPQNVKRELIIGRWENKYRRRVAQVVVLLRFLVSTPWRDLLHIRVVPALKCKDSKRIKVQIHRIDVERRRPKLLCAWTALRNHAVFVGQNHSACLSVENFPELRPNCIYFTSSCVFTEPHLYGRGWGVVKVYDLNKRTLQDVFPCSSREYANKEEDGIWITPNL